jgi:hypothetical protein
VRTLPSLRDSKFFDHSPSVETLGLDMLSPAGTGAARFHTRIELMQYSTALLEQDDKRRDAVRIRHRFVWKRRLRLVLPLGSSSLTGC